jgi:hypothetical protein
MVGRNLRERKFENGGDAVVGVMRLLGGKNPHAGARSRRLAGDPQSLKIGQRSTRCKVAKVLRPAKHAGKLADRLNFHLRTGPSAVASMVVGIDLHRQSVGGAGKRMRRLEHLPGIQRVEVGIVVAQTVGDALKNACHPLGIRGGCEAGKRGKLSFKQLRCAG